MKHRKRPLSLLFVGIISFIVLGSLIYFFPPTMPLALPQILETFPLGLDKWIQIPPLIIFFLLFAIFLFSLGSYLFKSKTHGVLVSGLVVTYLLFRLSHLTHPFFLILLLALFFVLELFVSSRK